jgi:predicted DCC family thiol-disulfide oxidoreductase YuxK
MTDSSAVQLTLLFDGACPLCMREVRFLKVRDLNKRIAFVDIDAQEYAAADHGGITYREAMGRIHALRADGTVLQDVEVFREAYRLVGLGWVYAPTRWPLIGPLVNGIYRLWASQRLRLTRRPGLDQLCKDRCNPESVARA